MSSTAAVRAASPLVGLIAAVLFPSAAAAGDPAAADVAAVVAQVQARYDATTDFTARVRQEHTLSSAGKTITYVGSVAFKKPGRMRWELRNDDEQIIVADGQTLWFYQPAEKQVLRAPFRAAFRSTTPVSFLTGVGRLADDFEVKLERRDGERLRLELRPRQGEEEIGRMWLVVAAGTHDIVGAEVRDELGNVTRISFEEMQRNVGIDDGRFAFAVPSGVDVVDAPIGY